MDKAVFSKELCQEQLSVQARNKVQKARAQVQAFRPACACSSAGEAGDCLTCEFRTKDGTGTLAAEWAMVINSQTAMKAVTQADS